MVCYQLSTYSYSKLPNELEALPNVQQNVNPDLLWLQLLLTNAPRRIALSHVRPPQSFSEMSWST